MFSFRIVSFRFDFVACCCSCCGGDGGRLLLVESRVPRSSLFLFAFVLLLVVSFSFIGILIAHLKHDFVCMSLHVCNVHVDRQAGRQAQYCRNCSRCHVHLRWYCFMFEYMYFVLYYSVALLIEIVLRSISLFLSLSLFLYLYLSTHPSIQPCLWFYLQRKKHTKQMSLCVKILFILFCGWLFLVAEHTVCVCLQLSSTLHLRFCNSSSSCRCVVSLLASAYTHAKLLSRTRKRLEHNALLSTG